jgi:HTH-type transcriptional regulator/antitoxin HigA
METEEMMAQTVPSQETQAISQAWLAFKKTIGVTSIHTKAEYERARAIMKALVDEVRGNEDHPLADLLEYIGDQMWAWEEEHVTLPEAPPPHEMLRFLMDQHKLQPEDLADYAPQKTIVDILAGKRAISKTLAKKFAQRFHVDADLFL